MSTTLARSPQLTRVPDRDAVMAQMGQENFPVALRLLGRPRRRALMAIYGFARLVDDIGDEAPGDRLALLDWLEGELRLAYSGGRPEHPVMVTLAEALHERPLPEGPFRRLIEANRRDQRISRYATFDELLDYCQLSAAPVGELVLHVFGAGTPERVSLSDRICAGLQVIEHLQDIREDYTRGRIYLPQEDLLRFGCHEEQLGAPTAAGRLPELVAFEASRAGTLLAEGAPLIRTLPLRPRLAVAAFLAGGRAALEAIGTAGFDTLRGRPVVRRGTFVTAWASAMRGA